ncbi:PEP-CTERM sorting domain-containing protein [Janthinobacterium agaricidamnosum]|uniref:PEP-CTERM putative exosortase interaction domain protein n=1 Tax=Janthinobacterium agaricidamnosum NBRC 102515 = DSM 9628 TaxID=1349767 RepID=W0V4C2_9BURK|nr:PEP-CTERM sorting domain-containing protein [Janthinobacterium agaricidamnosum]CDG82731.1 PEP-CTERM putative exosortase interaction domain protein [Janthinobacterium agaricidamnosum NBRC 102515 = DSM 9628]
MKKIHFAKLLLSTLIVSASMHAHATTYSNVGLSSTPIWTFGKGATPNYGETFTSPGGILEDFTFYALSGTKGNAALTIAAWDGNKAIGPALYTSSPISYGGGAQAIGATGINLALQANTSYIAYLTVAGVTSPIPSATFQGSGNNGGLPGKFVYSTANDPLLANQSWSPWTASNMAYTANITAAVPEPETYGMLLAGLGLIGFAVRRKARPA